MDALFEQNVTHNLALSALAIAQAAIQFKHDTNDSSGLDLFAALLIPPLVFHRRTAIAFANRQKTEGLFYRVIADDRELIMGTQSRLVDMTSRTMKAIHLGCSARLFNMVHGPRLELVATSKSLPGVVDKPNNSEGVRTILAAASRIGHCFATTELSVICTILRVRF